MSSARQVRHNQERRAFSIVSGRRGHPNAPVRSAQLARYAAAASVNTSFSPSLAAPGLASNQWSPAAAALTAAALNPTHVATVRQLQPVSPSRRSGASSGSAVTPVINRSVGTGLTPTVRRQPPPSTPLSRSPKLALAARSVVSPTARALPFAPPSPQQQRQPRQSPAATPQSPSSSSSLSADAAAAAAAHASLALMERLETLERATRGTAGELASMHSMLGTVVGQLQADTQERGLTQRLVNKQLDAMAEMVVERVTRESRDRVASEQRSVASLELITARVAALASQGAQLATEVGVEPSGSSGGGGGGGGLSTDVRKLRAHVERLAAADATAKLPKLAAALAAVEQRASRVEAATAENAATAGALRDGAAMLVHTLEQKAMMEVGLLDRRVAATEGSAISVWRAHHALEGIVRAEVATRLEHERYAAESALAARRAAAFRMASLEQAIVANTDALSTMETQSMVEGLVRRSVAEAEARVEARMGEQMAAMEARLQAALDQNAAQDAEQDEDSLRQWDRIETLDGKLQMVEQQQFTNAGEQATRFEQIEEWNYTQYNAAESKAVTDAASWMVDQVVLGALETDCAALHVEVGGANLAGETSVALLAQRNDAADDALRVLREDFAAFHIQVDATNAAAAAASSAGPGPVIAALEGRLAVAEGSLTTVRGAVNELRAASPIGAKRAKRAEETLSAMEDRVDGLDERLRRDHREAAASADEREDAQRKVVARAAAAAEEVHDELRAQLSVVRRKIESTAVEAARIDDSAREARSHLDVRLRTLESREIAAPGERAATGEEEGGDGAAVAVEGEEGGGGSAALAAELSAAKALLETTVRRVDRLEAQRGEDAAGWEVEAQARRALDTKLVALERAREETQHTVETTLRKLGSNASEAEESQGLLQKTFGQTQKTLSELSTTVDSIDERTTRLDLDVRQIVGSSGSGGASATPSTATTVMQVPAMNRIEAATAASAKASPRPSIKRVPSTPPSGKAPAKAIIPEQAAAVESDDSSDVELEPERPLPPGWQSCFDSVQNATYYVEIATGESTWERPE